MFLGESRHQLDAKNRLRVPAKFRSELGGKYVVTVGSNECLCVYAYDKFADYVAKLESIPSFDLQAQRSIRKILSLASEVEPDEQGRFILPANLKDFAKIDKNIVINGAGSKVEIWSEEKWDSYSAIENFDQELAEIGTKIWRLMLSPITSLYLPKKCIEFLNVRQGGIYVDCTAGGGGHSALILEKLSGKGKLLAFDKDDDAIRFCAKRFEGCGSVELIKSDFKNAARFLAEKGLKPDGILMDLGISSHQIDEKIKRIFVYEPGFRFGYANGQNPKSDCERNTERIRRKKNIRDCTRLRRRKICVENSQKIS